MEALYNILKDYTLQDAIDVENSDPMFVALSGLYEGLNNKDFFIPLIIANSLICYQLSSTGEEYWEEFSKQAEKYTFKGINDIFLFLIDFLPKSNGNKRLVPTKLERLKKLKIFLDEFFYKQKYYYNNMEKLQVALAKEMKQKKTAKTIVFAVKMLGYGARIRFGETKIFPKEINIPIDSRLENIYKVYSGDYTSSTAFYHDLSERLDIPALHLDAILWVNYKKILDK